jgi:leucyl-tRNA synthetase
MNCWIFEASIGLNRCARCKPTGSTALKALRYFLTETGDPIEVFTTRPDTLWGATFMVLAPEHPLVKKVTTTESKAVDDYIASRTPWTIFSVKRLIRRRRVSSPVAMLSTRSSDERIPIWIADYVLMTYGTGAIMAVPAHDQRDFEFARKYSLPCGS